MRGQLKSTVSPSPGCPFASLVGTITFINLANLLPELFLVVLVWVSKECVCFIHYFADCISSLSLCPSHLPH